MIERLTTGILLLLALLAGESSADIYRHEDTDGIVSFTDTPTTGRYSIYLREKKQPRGDRATMTTTETGHAEYTQLPIHGRVTSPSGLRHDPLDGKLRHHNGIDIAAPTGTPVKAVAPGIVVYSGRRNGYGNMVIVDHRDGMQTIYAHHTTNLVTEGDRVDRSTVIALSGSTGRSTGPHLHFEAWRDGVNVTRIFMPGSVDQPRTAFAHDTVTRILQNDGTILFTNLR